MIFINVLRWDVLTLHWKYIIFLESIDMGCF